MSDSDKVHAPFTPDQVHALNEYQIDGYFHPFTCPNRKDHMPGILVATEAGWVCSTCEYTQDWCLEFMARYKPKVD